MREKLIFPSRSLIVLSLIFECLAATGSWRIQTRRILIENGLDVCLPKRVLKSKNVRIDEEYIYLLEPDLKAGIENRDERNWLLAMALRDCEEKCLVFGGKELCRRCWILCGKLFDEGVRNIKRRK